MATIIAASHKQGSLILEVCPGSGADCPNDHPKKVAGSRGRTADNNYEEVYDTASHQLFPFRLTDGTYDLNEDRAAAAALQQLVDAIEERYGTGTKLSAHVGKRSG